MKLLVKFSLIFVVVFAIGLGGAGWFFYRSLQRGAREQVLSQAEIIMETAKAMRDYTTEQVKPVLSEEMRRQEELVRREYRQCEAAHQQRAADEEASDGAVPKRVARQARRPFIAVKHEFRPQTVPAFAATEIFGYLRKKYPEYFYKEATLNPTNPRNRAVDWEQDIIKLFRNNPDMKTFDGERQTPYGTALYVARPLRAGKSCMECHSVPAIAPAEMVKQYGTANGFGWKENEIVAAQIVSVPAALPLKMADRAFRDLGGSLIVVALAALVLLDLVLYFTVIRPVSRFATMADEISKGNMDVPELEVKGRDEISVLAAAFNRMHRSLSAAMKLLQK